MMGEATTREQIDADVPANEIVNRWRGERDAFESVRSKYLLYK
jgi:uncharacterized protein YbbC (DUF1343 family)